MHRRTYLVLLIRYQLNSRCSGRSEIKAIGQQCSNHKISFRFYIISLECLTFSSVAKSTKNWSCLYCLHKRHSSPMRFFHIIKTLSSAEASLCCGEAGEKEKESARGTMGRFPARFLFLSIIDILMGIPSGSLCGGESYQDVGEKMITKLSKFKLIIRINPETLLLYLLLELNCQT